jgi:hypothetical protein
VIKARTQRPRISMLSCITGTIGSMQIKWPLAEVEGLPVGVLPLGVRDSDETAIAGGGGLADTRQLETSAQQASAPGLNRLEALDKSRRRESLQDCEPDALPWPATTDTPVPLDWCALLSWRRPGLLSLRTTERRPGPPA